MKPVRVLSVLAMSLAALIACGSDSDRLDTGSAALEWQVAARDCARADVETVRIEIEGGWKNERGVSHWDFTCTERRGEVPELAPGRYVFVLNGLATDGVTSFLGRTEQVEVRSRGVARPGTVILEARPADLRVEWTFGGPFCSHVGVAEVELIAFDSFGSAIGSAREGCDTGRAHLLLRPGAYDVAVFGLGANGQLLYHSVFEVGLLAGHEHTERVTLEVVEAPSR